MKEECQGSLNANQYTAISATNVWVVFFFLYNNVSNYYFSLPNAPFHLQVK